MGELFDILYKQTVGFNKWNCTSIVTLDHIIVPKDELEEVKEKFDNVFRLIGKNSETSVIVEKVYGSTPEKKIVSLS